MQVSMQMLAFPLSFSLILYPFYRQITIVEQVFPFYLYNSETGTSGFLKLKNQITTPEFNVLNFWGTLCYGVSKILIQKNISWWYLKTIHDSTILLLSSIIFSYTFCIRYHSGWCKNWDSISMDSFKLSLLKPLKLLAEFEKWKQLKQ